MPDPTPTTLSFLLCDDVRPRYGPAADLLGLHHTLVAAAVPAVRPELCVYWLATGMTGGRHRFELVLTDADDTEVWPATPVGFEVNVPGPRAVVEWSARVQNVPLPTYGEYRWQVREHGVAVAERRYVVAPAPERVQPPPQPRRSR